MNNRLKDENGSIMLATFVITAVAASLLMFTVARQLNVLKFQADRLNGTTKDIVEQNIISLLQNPALVSMALSLQSQTTPITNTTTTTTSTTTSTNTTNAASTAATATTTTAPSIVYVDPLTGQPAMIQSNAANGTVTASLAGPLTAICNLMANSAKIAICGGTFTATLNSTCSGAVCGKPQITVNVTPPAGASTTGPGPSIANQAQKLSKTISKALKKQVIVL